MNERGFVDALYKTLQGFDGAMVLRPNDGMTLGIPDLLAWIPWSFVTNTAVWPIAIEAKQLQPLMKDPFHRGRRTGKLLKHSFTGPQISMLRRMKHAGVDAFGIVRASADTAFRIEPDDLDAKTGNLTHEDMVTFGRRVIRKDGLWRFWET